MYSHNKVKAATSLAFLLLLAGCNSSGMNLGGDSSSGEPVVLSSLLDTDTSSFDLEGGSETSDDGAVVARIHNPEPATMLLWGMGLAGAAFSRRRKKG